MVKRRERELSKLLLFFSSYFLHFQLNPLTPKIRMLFLPLAATHFLVNKLQEFNVRSSSQLIPNKF